MTESGRKFIETYKKESQALAEREAEAAGGNKEGVAEVNIAKIKDEPAENEGKDGGDKDISEQPAATDANAKEAAPKWD